MMLPSDRYLAEILGLTEEQYRHFQIEVRKRAAEGPQPAVVAGLETAAVLAIANLVVGLGALAVSALLKPSVPQVGQAPGQPRQRQDTTDPIIRNDRFAPRYGFDSQQDIATLGSIIPIVYANRELIDGNYYGGIRINMPMLWNQILSLGGGQMLRGVFLLGEGPVSSLDATGFAIGSNTLQSYVFDNYLATEQGARVTVYFSPDGGRITGTDRVLGRTNVNDDGSSRSTDVFQVYWTGAGRQDFCSSNRPSTQTTFGVYAPIGNDLMYKVNPVIRPGVRSQYESNTNDGRLHVECPNDDQQLNTRNKFRAHFSTFSGIIGNNSEASVSAGDTLTYKLFSSSDWNTTFPAAGGGAETVEAKDVASSVASKQKAWDDRIVVGELYKIGDLLAVCTSRTDDQLVSQADLDGSTVGVVTVTANFTALEGGSVKGFTEAHLTDTGGDAGQREKGTTGGHLLRYARAQISTTRGCQAVELGIKSVLGIRINGLCNFRDAKTYEFADTNYCREFENADIDEIKSSLYISGVITSPVQRYSFFKIKHRDVSSSAWTTLTHAYGVRSETQQALFTYIRLEFSSVKQREFMFEPLSGFEVRQSRYGAGATLYVLDPKKGRITVNENGTTVVFNGESVALNETNFGITYGRANTALADSYAYEGRTLDGLPLVDVNTYIDDYGKLAETFVYSEISTTAESGPEHEIVYVNEIVPNTSAPLYDDLALVGINIRSSAEFQRFAQFSSYVTGGKECTRMLGGSGATHLFPDVLYDLMTNTRYGAGTFIKPYMIDTAEFAAAAQWCLDRKYFYDAAVAEPINIRWAADLAATHLLQFGETNGKYFLRPAISFTAVTISGLFTAGNIAEGSFQLQYFDPEDRDPIQVSARYREERPSTDLTSPGLFPVMREVLVREATASETDPIEQLDMSAYCTSCEHAVDAAKFLVRMRRIPQHMVSFRTMHDGLTAGLAPGDYIKVAMDETEYDEFNNGVVTPEGALVSTKPLSDGTYTVVAWDGTEGTPPADTTLTVSNSGKTASPTGIVFTVKLPSTQVRVYQIERIAPDDEGTFTIEAMHMPVNSSGILEVADGFDAASNWTILGSDECTGSDYWSMTIDTTKRPAPYNDNFTVLTTGAVDYNVDWGDGTIEEGFTSSSSHVYAEPGVYVVKITVNEGGIFRPYYDGSLEGHKITQLNASPLGFPFGTNLQSAFRYNDNLISIDQGMDVSGVTDFTQTWSLCQKLTSFPLINVSSGTNFLSAWSFCIRLTSFPALNASSGTNFANAWSHCTALESFSLVNVSSGTIFRSAWYSCSNLTSFAPIDVSSGIDFANAWAFCTSLTSFPPLDASSGTDFSQTWLGCSSLTSFPLVNVSNGTNFYRAWRNCSSLISFEALNASSGTNFQEAWSNCSGLTSFPLVNVSNGTNFYRAWYNCSSLISFEALNASSGTNFQEAWSHCYSLTSFPALIDLSKGTNFHQAWYQCIDLTSFPALNLSSGTNFSSAWSFCGSLTSFPALIDLSSGTDFSGAWAWCASLTSFPALNLSNGTNFSSAWSTCSDLTSFSALIDVSSGTDFSYAWNRCVSLTSFPSININNGTSFYRAWENCNNLASFPVNFFDSWTGTPANNCFVDAWKGFNNLDKTSVENILNSIDTSGQSAPASGVDITIDYNAGSGTPSVATAITNLKARGWTITLNGVAQ